MRKWWILASVAVGVLLLGCGLRNLVISWLMPRPLPAAIAYPKPVGMPALVPDRVEDLLARYEKLLSEKAPAVLAAMQPGLNDVDIDALEKKYAIKLTPDLRALYRWRNGTKKSVWTAVFPDHRFMPLDEAMAERERLAAEVKKGTSFQQSVHAKYAGYRNSWVGLLQDGAGDGYSFDPSRSEGEGSFFFNFAEDCHYVFFPAFRNFLAGVLDGYDTGTFQFGPNGAETKDFVAAQKLWLKYGAENPR